MPATVALAAGIVFMRFSRKKKNYLLAADAHRPPKGRYMRLPQGYRG